MTLHINVGDGAVNQPDIVPIAVNAGETITIKNLTGGNTLSVLKVDINGASTSVSANASTTVTQPAWMKCASNVTTVELSGGIYGA